MILVFLIYVSITTAYQTDRLWTTARQPARFWTNDLQPDGLWTTTHQPARLWATANQPAAFWTNAYQPSRLWPNYPRPLFQPSQYHPEPYEDSFLFNPSPYPYQYYSTLHPYNLYPPYLLMAPPTETRPYMSLKINSESLSPDNLSTLPDTDTPSSPPHLLMPERPLIATGSSYAALTATNNHVTTRRPEGNTDTSARSQSTHMTSRDFSTAPPRRELSETQTKMQVRAQSSKQHSRADETLNPALGGRLDQEEDNKGPSTYVAPRTSTWLSSLSPSTTTTLPPKLLMSMMLRKGVKKMEHSREKDMKASEYMESKYQRWNVVKNESPTEEQKQPRIIKESVPPLVNDIESKEVKAATPTTTTTRVTNGINEHMSDKNSVPPKAAAAASNSNRMTTPLTIKNNTGDSYKGPNTSAGATKTVPALIKQQNGREVTNNTPPTNRAKSTTNSTELAPAPAPGSNKRTPYIPGRSSTSAQPIILEKKATTPVNDTAVLKNDKAAVKLHTKTVLPPLPNTNGDKRSTSTTQPATHTTTKTSTQSVLHKDSGNGENKIVSINATKHVADGNTNTVLTSLSVVRQNTSEGDGTLSNMTTTATTPSSFASRNVVHGNVTTTVSQTTKAAAPTPENADKNNVRRNISSTSPTTTTTVAPANVVKNYLHGNISSTTNLTITATADTNTKVVHSNIHSKAPTQNNSTGNITHTTTTPKPTTQNIRLLTEEELLLDALIPYSDSQTDFSTQGFKFK